MASAEGVEIRARDALLEPRRTGIRARGWGQITLAVGGTIFFLVLMLFPFYWMLVVSVKANSQLYDASANPFIATRLTLDHYVFLFTRTQFLRWTLNSVVVSVASCGFSLVLSIMAGYSLARLRYRGAGVLGWLMFITYLIPPTLLFLPLTAVMSQLGLLNSLWSLIFSYPTFLIPFCTWLLMGYFKGIPMELEESAVVDGCSRFQAMRRIAVPLALPGILSAGIFAFTLSWNEYIYALSFISDGALKTIPYGVPSDLIRGDAFFWGELMAAALLGSVPVAVLYSFFVDHFVSGMTAGAVKG